MQTPFQHRSGECVLGTGFGHPPRSRKKERNLHKPFLPKPLPFTAWPPHSSGQAHGLQLRMLAWKFRRFHGSDWPRNGGWGVLVLRIVGREEA